MVVSVAGWLGIEAAQVSEANFSLRTGERSCVSGFAICDTLAMRAETPATLALTCAAAGTCGGI